MNNQTTFLYSEKYKTPYIIIPTEYESASYCVFKLFYNNKFIVLMGKTLHRQVEIIRTNLGRFIKNKGIINHKSEKQREDFCLPFYEYIMANPNGVFRLEIVVENAKPYKMLQANQRALDEGFKVGNCLNLNWQPVVSRYVQTPNLYLKDWEIENKKYLWMNRGHFLNFKKWQYNRNIKDGHA